MAQCHATTSRLPDVGPCFLRDSQFARVKPLQAVRKAGKTPFTLASQLPSLKTPARVRVSSVAAKPPSFLQFILVCNKTLMACHGRDVGEPNSCHLPLRSTQAESAAKQRHSELFSKSNLTPKLPTCPAGRAWAADGSSRILSFVRETSTSRRRTSKQNRGLGVCLRRKAMFEETQREDIAIRLHVLKASYRKLRPSMTATLTFDRRPQKRNK